MKTRFLTETIDNAPIKDNFKRLTESLDEEPILRGNFKFFEMEFVLPVTSLDYPHHLGFQPTDIIPLTVSAGATVTYHHDLFTSDTINLTTSAPCKIRCYIGSYSRAN